MEQELTSRAQGSRPGKAGISTTRTDSQFGGVAQMAVPPEVEQIGLLTNLRVFKNVNTAKTSTFGPKVPVNEDFLLEEKSEMLI